jgi:hypothetical protein
MNARRKTRKILFGIPVLLLVTGMIMAVISGIRIYQIQDTQRAQFAAERWSGDSGVQYRQFSCFAKGQPQVGMSPDLYLSSEVSLNVSDIEAIRKNLNMTIETASGKTDEQNAVSPGRSKPKSEDSRLWIDAYSTQTHFMINRPKTDTSLELQKDVTLIGVGGDFFLIHNMLLESGAYLYEDTLDTKKIVIDTELAFNFFGTYNVVGESVYISGKSYTIVGVVRHPATEIDNRTQGEYMRAYILFPELSKLMSANNGSMPDQTMDNTFSEGDIGANNTELNKLAITSYEVVIPNRVTGIAKQDLLSAFEMAGKQESGFLFVENTERFSPFRLVDTLFPIGETDYSRRGYSVPFWESSARMAEAESTFWWVNLLVSVGLVGLCGLNLYTGVVKKKYPGQIQEVDESITT